MRFSKPNIFIKCAAVLAGITYSIALCKKIPLSLFYAKSDILNERQKNKIVSVLFNILKFKQNKQAELNTTELTLSLSTKRTVCISYLEY